MKALSIKQPWAWLICQGLKDIENRDWLTTFRGQVLIHAGKNYDYDAFDSVGRSIKRMGLETTGRPDKFEMGGIVGIATITDCVSKSDSVWFKGKYGFVLKDAKHLPFIPFRGQLGFFDVPDEIVEQLGITLLK